MPLFKIEKTPSQKTIHLFGLKIRLKRRFKLSCKERDFLRQMMTQQELLANRHINRCEIESKVENMRHYGLNTTPRNPRVIVTLTSYPARMYDLHFCLYSLLTQSFKPDKVVLWLGEDKFPEKELDVPKKVLALREFGLEIRWCKDIRSHTKLLPSLREFPEDILVTVDDDHFYPQNWLQALWDGYQHSGTITTTYTKKCIIKQGKPLHYHHWEHIDIGPESCGYHNMLYGYGSVLYPPHCLHPDVLDAEKALEICPTADDIWFWVHAVRNNSKIYKLPVTQHKIFFVNLEREMGYNNDGTLHSVNEGIDGANEVLLQRIYQYYPEFTERLRNET